jgi:hypothetical protein
MIGDLMPIGIIACAFGQQKMNTAGPSNEAIGQVALQIKRQQDAVISTQWEVDSYLRSINKPADNVTSVYGSESHYVSTEEVFNRSFEYFGTKDVTDVVVVAQPMHLFVIRLVMKDLMNNSGLHFRKDFDRLMRSIPFDQSNGNQQPWTRGPIRFGAYLVRVKLTGTHGS